MYPIEQLKSMSETTRKTTSRLAEVVLEGQEKMFRVNVDAAQEFLKTGGDQVKKSCSELAQVHPMEAWPGLIVENIQRNTDLNLTVIEITKHMQRELACVVEENLRALRDGTLEAVDKYAGVIGKMGSMPRPPRAKERLSHPAE